MAPDGIVIGIDGGGSKTTAWSIDPSGSVVARATGGSCDVAAIGEDGLVKTLQSLKAMLLAGVGAPTPVHAAAVGMPLYGEGADLTRRLDAICSTVFSNPLVVVNDVRIGLEAAFGSDSGIVVEAGTGSMAWGKTPDGREERCGGWGDAFGDEGSAYWIGAEALRQASQMWDGRLARSPMVDELLSTIGARDFFEVAQWVLTGRRRRIASLAPVVDAAAQDGDPAAREILQRAGTELARLCIALRDRLFAGAPPAVARYGGVFESRAVTDAFNLALMRAGISKSVSIARPPVAGACLLAVRVAGWDVERVDRQLALQYGSQLVEHSRQA